jgi:hypothetical protein
LHDARKKDARNCDEDIYTITYILDIGLVDDLQR